MRHGDSGVGGIVLKAQGRASARLLRECLDGLGLAACLQQCPEGADGARFWLAPEQALQCAQNGDTTGLCKALGLDTYQRREDLEREILLALLLGPVPFVYPSHEELVAGVRIRANIVQAARKTALAFHTSKIERPTDCWTYSEDRGFTVLPGVPLVHALCKATQPQASGARYAFSCYRATEYVILLAIAQELQSTNPALLAALQRQWEHSAIASGRFHDTFLTEYGSMEQPLPPRYYVPGDRLWFRNPDEASSDVTGYEGSWVFYHGDGLFTNFWQQDRPFTLTAKCVEIFHWRHGAYRDAQGEWQMDEEEVERRARATLDDVNAVQAVVQRMLRLREPKGVYRDGGCIDTTREYPRWVCPSSADMALPQPA